MGEVTVGRPSEYIHGKDPASRPGVDGSYPLLCHLLDTAVVAERLWRTRVRSGLRELMTSALHEGGSDVEPVQVLMLAAAAHDLGKANPWFQYQERHRPESEFAADLAMATGLGGSPSDLRHMLRHAPVHPLRRHEFISHRILADRWPREDDRVTGPLWLAMLVGGHHGYWRAPRVAATPVDAVGEELLGGWTAQQQAHLRAVEEAVGIAVDDVPMLPQRAVGSAVFACLSGLVTLADWLASDDEHVVTGKVLWSELERDDRSPHRGPSEARAWMAERQAVLDAHIERSLGPVAHVETPALRDAIVTDYTPTQLQSEALAMEADSAPGLWICMYPTGDGKTEAALLRGAVVPEEGFFFGLPTLATTDAMERRLQEIGSRLPGGSFPLIKSHQFARVAHATPAPTVSERAGEDSCDEPLSAWYSTSMRKLVATNVVGTVDQALTGALAQRHLTFRLFGLANRHVVLDEIHTFDAYQTDLLVELLYWWGLTRTRVTLLSATLPTRHMNRMVEAYRDGLAGISMRAEIDGFSAEFPSTVSVGWDGEIDVRTPESAVRLPRPTIIDRVAVASRAERVESHRAWAVDTAARYPTSPLAIVSNVVDDCIEIAAMLADDPRVIATHDVLCLHSRLVTAHRSAAEEHLVERAGKSAHAKGFGQNSKPILVVGTQVIQASLNFDVDFMATDLAPAPDLLQRLGRVWRFEDDLPGERRGGRIGPDAVRRLRVLSVLGPHGDIADNGARPYLSAVLSRTYDALCAEGNGPLDLGAFTQPWVDAAYNTDPFAFLGNDDEARRAVAEMVDQQSREFAAQSSRASLARTNADGGTPLLPATRRRGAAWKNLVQATRRSDDPDLMRTRFIEQEVMRVLLIDSRGTAAYRDPRSDELVRLPSEAPGMGRVQPSGTGCMASIPAAYGAHAREAVDATLDGSEWAPKDRFLRHTPPLDLLHLTGFSYDPIVGLRKEAAS